MAGLGEALWISTSQVGSELKAEPDLQHVVEMLRLHTKPRPIGSKTNIRGTRANWKKRAPFSTTTYQTTNSPRNPIRVCNNGGSIALSEGRKTSICMILKAGEMVAPMLRIRTLRLVQASPPETLQGFILLPNPLKRRIK